MYHQDKYSKILRSAHTVYSCVLYGPEQTAIISPHNIKRLVFATELKSVYCAVRTGVSIHYVSSFEILTKVPNRRRPRFYTIRWKGPGYIGNTFEEDM